MADAGGDAGLSSLSSAPPLGATRRGGSDADSRKQSIRRTKFDDESDGSGDDDDELAAALHRGPAAPQGALQSPLGLTVSTDGDVCGV